MKTQSKWKIPLISSHAQCKTYALNIAYDSVYYYMHFEFALFSFMLHASLFLTCATIILNFLILSDFHGLFAALLVFHFFF